MAAARMTVRSAIERDLERLPEELASSGLAAAALALARSMDNTKVSATARSMCARALLDIMDRLRELAPDEVQEGDWLDELADRRSRRDNARVAAS